MPKQRHVDRHCPLGAVTSHTLVHLKVVSRRRVLQPRKCRKNARQLLRGNRRTRQDRRRACDEKIVESHQCGHGRLYAKLAGRFRRLVRGRSHEIRNHTQTKPRFWLAEKGKWRKGKLCRRIERTHGQHTKQQILSQEQVFRFGRGAESAGCRLDSERQRGLLRP